tara:strand:+ start:462 stop:2936 length:2475 start_codon:yes stop_codon:yes gene_type:complete
MDMQNITNFDYRKPSYDEDAKLKKVFEREIRPKTNSVWFHLEESVVKSERLLSEKSAITKAQIELGTVEKEIVQNIGVPEMEDIDYSLIKDKKLNKFGELLIPYKDGYLIIRNDNPKIYFSLDINFYKEKFLPSAYTAVCNLNDLTYYVDRKTYQNLSKENFTLYIVFTRAHKNKAYKINLKNSYGIKETYKCFEESTDDVGTKKGEHIFNNLPKSITKKYTEVLGLFGKYETLYDQSQEGTISKTKVDFSLKEVSKKDLLEASYFFTLVNYIMAFVTKVDSFIDEKQDRNKKDKWSNNIYTWFGECKDEGEITKVTMKLIEKPIETSTIVKFLNKQYGERFEREKNMFAIDELFEEMLKICFLTQHCEQGLKLPLGYINYSKATEIDCLYYWNNLDFVAAIKNYLDISDFPLFLEEGEIFNKRELYPHIEEYKKSIGSLDKKVNETYNLKDEIKEQTSLILQEAMNQETGLLIPHNACVGLKDDPTFKYARFVEDEKYIHIFLHDEEDRYMSELFKKDEKEFRYWLVNRRQMFDKEENLIENYNRIYLKLACCIRDWKVLIERDTTMNYVGSRIPPGVKSDKKRQIWIPRVRYKRRDGLQQRKREKVFFSESRKFSGERRAHRRKLPKGMQPSKTQLVMAEASGVYLPEGHTFVRKSIWGEKNMNERQIKYRTKSLNGLLYETDENLDKHKRIAALSPAGFEEMCERYVSRLGWEVIKRNNYDGGIDIRAVREGEDGRVRKLFVQCKHYIDSGNPIGPDVVRELKGSVDLDEIDNKDCDIEMMVISSTRYTFKAVEAAEKLNIKLVKTDDIRKEDNGSKRKDN